MASILRSPFAARVTFAAGITVVLAAAGIGVSARRGAVEDAPLRAEGLALEQVAEGLRDPVYLTAPPGDRRLFVVEAQIPVMSPPPSFHATRGSPRARYALGTTLRTTRRAGSAAPGRSDSRCPS